MGEIIDRVALAICREDTGLDIPDSNGELDIYRQVARAAIEAMRESTEAMQDEADNMIAKCLYEPIETPRAFMIWRSMIDVALSEPSRSE